VVRQAVASIEVNEDDEQLKFILQVVQGATANIYSGGAGAYFMVARAF
jgi:hypothetical protein